MNPNLNIPLDDYSKQHITKLLNFLLDEVERAGGDGDALWYTRFYTLDDIQLLISVINNSLKFPWLVERQADDMIYWGRDQEGVIITTNKQIYQDAPSWQQILIKY